MSENLLRDLDVASGFQYALRERVAEQVRMNRDACLSTDVRRADSKVA